MDDALSMRVIESCSDVPEHAEAVVDLERLFRRKDVLERSTADESHRVVGNRLAVTDSKDRNDVGVIELGGKLRLPFEACVRLGREDRVERKHLQSNFAVERALFCAEHNAHAAATEQFHELEGIADRLLNPRAKL